MKPRVLAPGIVQYRLAMPYKAHISVDLDSTLFDTRHRHGVIEKYRLAGEPVDWEEYALACADDELTGFGSFLLQVQDGLNWHAVTGRSEVARVATLRQLQFHRLHPVSLSMEDSPEEHDRLGHVAWKARRVLQVHGFFSQIASHADDFPGVAEALVDLSDGEVGGFTVVPPGYGITKDGVAPATYTSPV